MAGPISPKPTRTSFIRVASSFLVLSAVERALFAVVSTAVILLSTCGCRASTALLAFEACTRPKMPTSSPTTPAMMPATGSMLLLVSREMVSMEGSKGGEEKRDRRTRQEEIIHVCQGGGNLSA